MRFELFRRGPAYLRAKRRQAFIGVITGISILGSGGGSGFADRGTGHQQRLSPGFAARLLGFDRAHQFAEGGKRRHARLGVPCSTSCRSSRTWWQAAPAIYEQVLISARPRARGAVLKGMLPQYERKVSDLRKLSHSDRRRRWRKHPPAGWRSLPPPGPCQE